MSLSAMGRGRPPLYSSDAESGEQKCYAPFRQRRNHRRRRAVRRTSSRVARRNVLPQALRAGALSADQRTWSEITRRPPERDMTEASVQPLRERGETHQAASVQPIEIVAPDRYCTALLLEYAASV